MVSETFIITLAYLIGNIRFAFIVCHMLGLDNPSHYGSKNPGATNVSRQNKQAGVLTLLLDASKPLIAYSMACLLSTDPSTPTLCLFIVTFGHIFPLLGRGGKGVACWLSSLAILSPAHGLAYLLIIFLANVLFKEVGLGSIVATILLMSAPPAMSHDLTLIFQITSVLILYAHRSNLKFLLFGKNLERS